MVEPKKTDSLLYDQATPKKCGLLDRARINDWQLLFEKGRVPDASTGKDWPEKDRTMSIEERVFLR